MAGLMADISERVLYEDNHIIIVNKLSGEIVQGDKTGDRTILDDVKLYLKEKYSKPGNVYLGLPHRLDRPTSGIVVLAKTEKALGRLSELFRTGKVGKTYWAVTDSIPDGCPEGRLVHWLAHDEKSNKSVAYTSERRNTQRAELEYRAIGKSDRYYLLEIRLLTGRHHQIRAQLAACGCHIKGDLKYGFPRSNPDGGICLHSRNVSFVHPVSGVDINVTAPVPECSVWKFFETKF